jgi:hypothetical protein
MSSVGLYECACNFWWQSFKPNQAAVNIPVNSRAVTNLANHWFPKAPDTMPFIIIVAAHPGLDVLANVGELIRVSPPETVQAFLISCAEACRAGANAAELEKWRRAMLTVTIRFEKILTQNDLYWRAANLREMVVSEFRAVALTPVQRICQVVEFKTAQERKAGGRLSAEAVAKLFMENLKMSDDSEQLSKNLVDNILTVWGRALSQPAVLAVVLEMEEFKHTPFDTILKMYTIVIKAQQPLTIKWVFLALADMTRAGSLGPGQASLAVLGHGTSAGPASLTHVLVRKQALRDTLIHHGTWLSELNVRFKVKEEFRCHFGSHEAFRKAVGFPDNEKSNFQGPDVSWRSDYTVGELLIRGWAEDLIFGTEYDAVIKQALKLKKTVDETIDYGRIGEVLTDCYAALANENAIREQGIVNQPQDGNAATTHPGHDGPDGEEHEGSRADEASQMGDDDMSAKRAKWRGFAAKLVQQHVKLVVEPKTQSLIPNLLNDTKPLVVSANDGEYILWVYDTKACGEAKSRAHARLPPVRDDHLHKLIGGAIRTRGTPDSTAALNPRDLYLILDGGRSDIEKPFNQCFLGDDGKVLGRSRRTIFLTYSEDGPHRRRMRGFTAINQVERLLATSLKTLQLQERPRLHFKGTNRGNYIGDLVVDRDITEFKLPRIDKKAVYGPHNTLNVNPGGPAGLLEVDDCNADGDPEEDTDIVPVFYHTMPNSFYQELIHSFCGKGVVHLTCGNGEFALACIEQRVPYVGMCFTEAHVQTLSEYLTNRVFEAMQHEGHPLYQATMVVQLGSLPSDATGPEGSGGPGAKAKAKAAAKAEAKAKAAAGGVLAKAAPKAEAKAAAKAEAKAAPKAKAGAAKAGAKAGAKAAAKAGAKAKAKADPDALAAALAALEAEDDGEGAGEGEDGDETGAGETEDWES